MDFIMQNWLKIEQFSLFVLLGLMPCYSWANDYSSKVLSGKTEHIGGVYSFSADIEFNLSPTAKEALQKGIALTWEVAIKIEEQATLWNSTLKELEIGYKIQNHALLNQYSVKINNGSPTLFSTLNAALDFMSNIRNLVLIKEQFIHQDRMYNVAIKVTFDREALPIPLRPLSYFDSQWALSSPWTVWPISK
jgi:hypothetical protein